MNQGLTLRGREECMHFYSADKLEIIKQQTERERHTIPLYHVTYNYIATYIEGQEKNSIFCNQRLNVQITVELNKIGITFLSSKK